MKSKITDVISNARQNNFNSTKPQWMTANGSVEAINARRMIAKNIAVVWDWGWMWQVCRFSAMWCWPSSSHWYSTLLNIKTSFAHYHSAESYGADIININMWVVIPPTFSGMNSQWKCITQSHTALAAFNPSFSSTLPLKKTWLTWWKFWVRRLQWIFCNINSGDLSLPAKKKKGGACRVFEVHSEVHWKEGEGVDRTLWGFHGRGRGGRVDVGYREDTLHALKNAILAHCAAHVQRDSGTCLKSREQAEHTGWFVDDPV